jgi:type VI secretion system secreted protein VgrG
MAHPISVTTPLPAEELFFESMKLSCGLSALGEMELQLLGSHADIAAADLLGKALTVHVELRDGSQRHFNGYVTRFGAGAQRGRHYAYQATVRPWLWFLTRTHDCRIFQELTVPDIVQQVFADHGIARFELKLFRQYRTRTYCVQYRESDYDFVARLMEDEGIYWFFKHDDGEHTLVMVDAQGAHDPAAGFEKLPYVEDPASSPPDTDYVSGWTSAESVRAGKTVLTSYDFEKPSTSLEVQSSLERSHEQAKHEVFDYPGDYLQKKDGEQLAENRMEHAHARGQHNRGVSNVLGLEVGCTFKLEKHPADRQNDEYLITQMNVQAEVAVFDSTGRGSSYSCAFGAMPRAQQYRPPRRTRRPFVQGPQTAVVVGPGGDEIHTDKYGRVKLQFHWDRYGRKDDTSSCWVRVSHPWAGQNFGAVHIPRMGQEVVVDFLEGDPDRPIITGRVYNAEQMPPWDLPANATQSGILTRSSKGGAYANANAIRFEDKAGSEQLWVHAEKNQDIEVENDETHWVGHDRSKTIDHDETVHVKHDRTETVDNNETITIGVDRKEKVGKNETITIGVNRTESVGANEDITIGANRTESVGANETVSIGANQSLNVGANRDATIGASETVTVALQRTHTVGINETIAIGAAQEVAIGAAQSINVGANQSTSVGNNRSISVGAELSTNVGGDEKRTVGKGRTASVGQDDALKVGKNLVIEAGDSVSIKTGSSSILMKKDGTITIKGKDITIEGSGKINVKASKDVVIKGSKVLQN